MTFSTNDHEGMSRTYEEVEELIRRDPDVLSEQEIESYLNIAEVQANLDRDNFLGAIRFS